MLKNPLKSLTPKDKARYDIEKRTSKDVHACYQKIDKLNVQYDALTAAAEKAFERHERAFQTSQTTLDGAAEIDRLALAEQHIKERDKAQQALKKLKSESKTRLEALKLDHKKTILVIEDELSEIDQERRLTLKEIEKKHRTSTTLFENKLKLYEKNLRKNQEETLRKFETTTTDLKHVLTEHEKGAHPVFTTFESELKTLESTLDKLLNENQETLESREKTFHSALNRYRKALNQHTKDLSQHMIQVQSAFEAPFSAFSNHVSTYRTTTLSQIAKEKKLIDDDYKHVLTSIEKERTDQRDEPADPKHEKDIQARLKLSELKHETLIKQNTVIAEIIEAETFYLSTALDTDKVFVSDLLSRYEAVFKTHIDHVKTRMNTIEKHFKTALEHTTQLEQSTHDATRIHAVKTLVKDCFEALDLFEKKRLNAHIELIDKMRDKVIEIDDLTMALDTVEPLKEIEINQQRMVVDQQDAALRLDMRTAKLRYDLAVKNIRHGNHIQEQDMLADISRAQAEKDINDLHLKQKHDTHVLEIKAKTDQANALFTLRKKHLENDIGLLDSRADILKEKAGIDTEIKQLTIQNEHEISHLELERETEEQTIQQTYEIDQHKQTLNLSFDKKRKLTDQMTKKHQVELKTFDKFHQTKRNEIDRTLESETKKHRERRAFIDKALERETEKPTQNINEINAMAKHRLTLIKDNLAFIQAPLKETETALTDSNIELKKLLVIIGKPFQKTLNETIDQWYETFTESHTFIADVMKRHIETEEQPAKKKQSALLRHEQDTERTLQKLTKQKALLVSSLNSRIEDARKLVKAEKKPTFSNLKQIIKPLHDLIVEKTNLEAKQLGNTLKVLFAQLYHGDQALIDRAEENHKVARNQEKTHFNEIKTTLNNEAETLTSERDTARTILEAEQASELEKALLPLEKSITSNQKIIQDYQAQKDIYTERFREKAAELEKIYHDNVAMLNQTHQEELDRIETQTAKKKSRLLARLEDAKALLENEKRLHDAELEHLNNVLHEALEQNRIDYEQTKQLKDAEIEQLKKDATLKVDLETDELKQQNASFEEQSLSSLPRLETKIAEATRKIDEETTLNKQKITQLLSQLATLQSNLRIKIEEALNELKFTLDHQVGAFLAATDADERLSSKALLDDIVTTRDTFIEALIKDITKEITDRD